MVVLILATCGILVKKVLFFLSTVSDTVVKRILFFLSTVSDSVVNRMLFFLATVSYSDTSILDLLNWLPKYTSLNRDNAAMEKRIALVILYNMILYR